MKWWWLQGSTTEKIEGFRMELSRAWEPSDSSSVAQACATMGSRFCFLVGNKIEKEKHGEEEGEHWFPQWLSYPKFWKKWGFGSAMGE